MIFILKEYITHITNLYILHVPKPRMENKHFIMSISSFSLRKGKIIMERSLLYLQLNFHLCITAGKMRKEKK